MPLSGRDEGRGDGFRGARPLLRDASGRAHFLLGVNYWSRAGGPRMWERFAEDRVRLEVAQMRDIGLNVCRSFAFIPSFFSAPGQLDPRATARLLRFFDACSAAGLWTIPTALVGHMSGENYDFPGQRGRDPYSDAELLGWQQQLLRAIAALGDGHPAVIAYLASNEMPYWGGPAAPDAIRGWARGLREALRALDPQRPFGIGDGVMNLDGGDNGFNVETLRDLVDFVGPHSYHFDSDSFRQAVNAELCLRSLTHLGLPLIFEEFGASSTQAAEDHQALYYREVLHACLTAGACGALAWCFSDFDLVHEPPYSHHAFELGFGITRADGSEKPVCDELRGFARLVDRLGFHDLQTPHPRAAIVVPSYYVRAYPFSREDRARMRRTLLQAYALCVAAGIEAELVPEQADLRGYRLLLAPATQKLLAPTWLFFDRHVAAGNTVYWSYYAGDTPFQFGAWCPDLPRLTGCQHRLRYGCADLPPAELTLAGDGLRLALRTDVGAPISRARLPVELLPGSDAEVLATDDAGTPALVRRRHPSGGRFLLLTYPLEFYLGEQPEVTLASAAPALYATLAREAGLTPAVRCESPAVQARVLRDADGALLWLLNHGWQRVDAAVDTPGGDAIHGATTALPEGQATLSLEPKQVAVFRLRDDPGGAGRGPGYS